MAVGRGVRGSQKLAKVALAKTNSVSVTVDGLASGTVNKVNSMAQSLGIGFNADGTSVTSNAVNDELDAREWHGVTSGMDVSISADPRYFDVASGVYYTNGIRVVFAGATVDTVSVPGGSFASVVIDAVGNFTLNVGSFPTNIDIEAGKLEVTAFSKLDANTIDKIGNSFFTSYDFVKKMYVRAKLFDGTKFTRNAGKVYSTGLALGLEGGYINTPNAEVKMINAEASVIGQEIYRVGGVYTIRPEGVVSFRNAEFDDGDLTVLGNNKFVVHTVARSSRTDSVYVIIGDTAYNKSEVAIDADYNLGIFEGAVGSEIEPLANVIVEKGGTEPIAIIDLRGGIKVTTSSLASAYESRLNDLEARVLALETA
jgi:hypothetical protein